MPERDVSPARAVGDFPKWESQTPALAGELFHLPQPGPPARVHLSLRRQATYHIPLDKS